MFVKTITMLGILATTAGFIMLIITIVFGIIGIAKKDYTNFKKSLKILLITVGVYILTIILFGVSRLVGQ